MMKKIVNYKYITIILILVACLFSFVFEVTFGNYHYYHNEFKGEKKISNIDNQVIDDNLIMLIKTDKKYVYELSFKVNIANLNNIDYELYYKDENDNFIKLSDNTLYTKYDGIVAMPIHKETNEIKLLFKDCNSLKLDNVLVTNNFQINYLRIFIVSVIIYLILDLIKIILSNKKPKLYLYYLKITVLIGISFALLTPLFYSYDENQHLIRSYNNSYGNFILQNSDIQKWPTKLGNLISDRFNFIIPSTYTTYKNSMSYLTDLGKSEESSFKISSTAGPYLFVAYLASGLGMFLGRLFNLSFPIIFYLGRIFNVILYALIVSLAIKLCKKTSKLIFAFGLIPPVIFQSGSYSADVFTNAFCLLSFGLTFHYIESNKKIGVKELLVLLLVYSFTYLSKIAYFPITLLIWLIPKEKFKVNSLWSKILVSLSGIILFGFGTIYASKFGIVQYSLPGVDVKLQMLNIIKNPFKYLYVIINTFQTMLIPLISASLGQLAYCGNLGDIEIILIIIGLIIVTLSTDLKLKNKDKFIILIYVICSIGASLSALYLSFNPVGALTVDGFQGRYLFPVLMAIFMLFNSSKCQLKVQKENVMEIIISIFLLVNIHAIIMILNNFYV